MKKECFLIGFIGAMVGNSIIFSYVAIGNTKYGTLADWVSGLGTIAAIFCAYWQIQEQRKEFSESKTYSLKIACGVQRHMKKIDCGEAITADRDLYIWAVNDGLTVGSFKFLGFCRKEDLKRIDTDDVIYNPDSSGLQQFLPHTTNDFELLHPGQVSKEKIIPMNSIDEALRNPQSIYILYMNPLGEIYKQEVIIRQGGE